ncbi:hypothetical protein MmiHf6_10320 [Methanimicrococcus hongohii]|uniref:Uncharacterized protein n=1 Tax=Methanimicrococcus hongohii TaxID=3028295 RepID=A0AA96V278_9EURY|nr:hypothetical protein [Methanimicrococcus sp. Hf6]WNY23718.1 hypothetical protein MmiHf6_10320 [Methanimicrococcus sp. Hf6]
MYTIGLIDEEEDQLRKIRKTIKSNLQHLPSLNEQKIDFKSYDLNDDGNLIVHQAIGEVINDVKENLIHGLIIDYKLIAKSGSAKGTDIYDGLKTIISEFPTVILTEIIEDCLKVDFVDPDKVYRKIDFFNANSEYSVEKTANIFRNMERYVNQRESLESNLEHIKEIMASDNSQEIVDELIKVETSLDNFVPLHQSHIDKAVDSGKLKEILELIHEINKSLE